MLNLQLIKQNSGIVAQPLFKCDLRNYNNNTRKQVKDLVNKGVYSSRLKITTIFELGFQYLSVTFAKLVSGINGRGP